MGKTTGISWTDHTWNPWYGCLKVSPGCKRCYMYRDMERFGRNPMIITRSKTNFSEPLKWKEPAMVFTCSWSDWFIEQADEWRPEAWEIIKRTPHLTYQILTKRPERIAGHLPSDWGKGYPNVWLGVSCENQEYADLRINHLLSVPAVIRFISAEPLLGPVDLTRIDYTEYARQKFAELATKRKIPGMTDDIQPNSMFINCLSGQWDDGWDSGSDGERIDWVIVGGESGPDRRPFEQEWAETIRDQCKKAGVAFFMKQMSALTPKLGAAAIPPELLIQEFPALKPEEVR